MTRKQIKEVLSKEALSVFWLYKRLKRRVSYPTFAGILNGYKGYSPTNAEKVLEEASAVLESYLRWSKG